MSLDSQDQLGRTARHLFYGQEATPPAGEFDRVMEAIHGEKKRNVGGGWWWSSALGLLFLGLITAYFYSNQEDSSFATDLELSSGILVQQSDRTQLAASISTSNANEYIEEKEQKNVSLVAPLAGLSQLSTPDIVFSSEGLQEFTPVAKAASPAAIVDSDDINKPNAADNTESLFGSANLSTAENNAARATSPLAPEEFNLSKLVQATKAKGANELGAGFSESELLHVNLAYSLADNYGVKREPIISRYPELQELLVLPTTDFPNFLSSNKFPTLSCPAFSLRGDRELRMNVYGGPRIDRQVFASVPNADLAYLQKRENLEKEKSGIELGIRGEVGRASGPFLGFGIQFGAYRSKFDILGPLRTKFTLEEVRDENGTLIRVDTATIDYRDTTVVLNRHNTMAFYGTGGYRHQLKRLSVYVAADLGYEIVTESGGAVATRDGFEYYSLDSDNWVNRRPGFTIGGRAGVDIALLNTIGEEPSQLGLLLEVNARNTGVFSGSEDVLSYRYSRIGFSTGLRYTF